MYSFLLVHYDYRCIKMAILFWTGQVSIWIISVADGYSDIYNVFTNKLEKEFDVTSLVEKLVNFQYKLYSIGFEALHGEVSIYIWFVVTMCVCTCQVEFILRELSSFIYNRGVDCSGVQETSQFWKENCPAFNYNHGGWYRQ